MADLNMHATMNQGQRQLQTQSVTLQQLKLQKFLEAPLTTLNVLMKDYIHDYPLLEIGGGDAGDFTQESIDDNRTDYDEYVGDSYADACEQVPDENRTDSDRSAEKDGDGDFDSFGDNGYSGGESIDPDQILNNIAATTSAYQELKEQLGMETCPPRVRRAALRIINSLDGRGILTEDLEKIEVAAHCTHEEALEALHLVQSLDPAGVGARSLQESLLLQLERHGIGDGPVVTLLREHYALVEQNDREGICSAMGIGEEELQELFAQIRRHTTLTPLGGMSTEPTLYVTPEVRVYEDENGEYAVEPLKDNLPDLYIREDYLQMLEDKATSPELREYIRKNLDGLREFRLMVEQRGTTIVQIAKQLVSAQHDFISDGDASLKPLTMSDVADRIGCDQSTVSRAIGGKFMETPRGMLPFNVFFARGTKTETGESITTGNVKKILQDLIDHEDKKKPLSDAKLTDLLTEKGINLSRRVIAKYREQLGIKNSSERKINR